jgi:hypothetical protein
MNKKNRLYLLILITLVVIFVLTRMGEKKEIRTSFFTIAPSDVGMIEISNQTDTLRLVLENDKWLIAKPFSFPTQQRRIDDLFDKVLSVQFSRTPLSESENSHKDFNVTDSLGTRLTILDKKGKIAADVMIGRNDNYHYANARNIGDKKVYQLLANITHNINPALSAWRNREIVALTDEKIRMIDIAFDKTKYSLTFADTVWIYENGKDKITLKSEQSKLKDMITSLQAYNASDFIDFEFVKYEKNFDNPMLEVMIKTFDNETIHLSYIEIENNRYAVLKDGKTDHLFVVYKNLVEKFMKTKSDFE